MIFPDWLRSKWAVGGAAVVVGAVGGYATGRLYGPTRIEERTRVEWKTEVVEKVVEKIVTVQGPVRTRTVTREVPVPGACDATGHIQTVTETEVVEDRGEVTTTTDTNRDTDLHELGVAATEKVTVREAPRLTLGATVGWDGMPTYGGFLTYRVLGPVVLLGQGEGGAGVWSARAGVGLQF